MWQHSPGFEPCKLWIALPNLVMDKIVLYLELGCRKKAQLQCGNGWQTGTQGALLPKLMGCSSFFSLLKIFIR